ncbi:hypothetical protein HELRODRAFT_191687 [Helobdella robusta]|uniref:cyclin-dependent kinase n=1 Tax=Helobdella robusta TaxID=6412 RepID=T1FT75_HELRO|nr:hypothetical protein HELRODRAFT_191687 [Helobdella robusta]ESO04680.1 hypothetical protein HELRODRAFT_191687 [Helobdella robusta]
MNKYKFIDVIGEGAYGIVMKYKNKQSGEICAIKKFKDVGDNEDMKITNMRELKLLKSLKHENIVSIKESFFKHKKLCIVFEYIPKNVLEILEEYSDGVPVDQLKWYIYQLCRAVNYCHDRNIIHRG